MNTASAPIGIFDSGYGGLTVFRSIAEVLPQYDYIYLGDNARAPYGPRPESEILTYTLQAVNWLFAQGCPLIILACNTASARALRSIQQQYLHTEGEKRRVLGVIRPTAEVIGSFTQTGKVGILGTQGTINSCSYPIEIAQFSPQLKVYQQSCPMWVPLIEEGKLSSADTRHYIDLYLNQLLLQDPEIDTILLACTHYPLLENKIMEALPAHIKVVSQGNLVAKSLQNYLQRHSFMTAQLSRGGQKNFFTTAATTIDFDAHAGSFFGRQIEARTLVL